MRTALVMLLLTLCTFLPTTSWSSTNTLFDNIQRANADVSALRISFIQSSKLMLFDAPLEVAGTLTLEKPQNLRWEYTKPAPSGFILHTDGGLQWSGTEIDKDIQQSELSPPLHTLANQILLWLNMDEVALARDFYFQISQEASPVITLQPKDKVMAAYVQSIVIELPESLQGVQTITVTETNGSVVTLAFDTPTINPQLSESTFTTP